MSEIDDFKKLLTEVMDDDQVIDVNSYNNNDSAKSFQTLRTELIDHLIDKQWIAKKEVEFLNNRMDSRSKEAFTAKAKGWILIDSGIDILNKMYK